MSESPYMTLSEVAAHFKVSDTSVRLCRGDLADLKRLRFGGRLLFLRASVEALDRKLQARARAASEPTDELRQRRAS